MRKMYAIIRFSLLLLISLSSVGAWAQNPQLNKYRFGEGLEFTGNEGYKINLRGYAQPALELKEYTANDETDALVRMRFRRLRLRLTGDAAQQKIDYRFQVDLSGSAEVADAPNELLLDAWVRYSITKRIRVAFGQRATPTDNRELYMGSNTLQLIERSRVTSAFASIREFGLFFDGRLRLKNGAYIKPYLTLTNGDGQNVFGRDYGGIKVGGRIDYLPFGLFTNFGQYRQGDIVRETAPKLVIGGTYSINYGMSSRRGRRSGDILYLDEEGNYSLPDYTKYGIDMMFKYRGFSMLAEFMGSVADVPTDITARVRNNGTVSNNFEVDGQQDVENYVKGRMMLGKGYNVQAGYIFRNLMSVDARLAYLDADQHSFLNNGTFYNRPRYYTLGMTKYFDNNYGFKIQGSFTYVDANEGSNDINGIGNPIPGNEWIARIMTTISF